MTSRAPPLALALAGLIAFAPDLASAQEPSRAGSPAQRIPRIGLELVLGTASGAGMAYGGFLLGCSLSGGASNSGCPGSGATGAIAGLALGAPLGVMLGGALLDGDGEALPTFFGTGVGVAAMVGGFLFLTRISAPVTTYSPVLLALPLVAGILGYELSSHDSRTAAQAEARSRRASWMIVPTATRDGFGVAVLYAP